MIFFFFKKPYNLLYYDFFFDIIMIFFLNYIKLINLLDFIIGVAISKNIILLITK